MITCDFTLLSKAEYEQFETGRGLRQPLNNLHRNEIKPRTHPNTFDTAANITFLGSPLLF
jgi:hypothetical protein